MQLKLITILTTLIILGLNNFLFARVSPIESYLDKSSVVIVGETGFEPQSTEYIKNLIVEYVNSNGCINIGLEISSDQQNALEISLKGENKFNKIKFNEYVDKDSYMDLLSGLRTLQQEGKCIKVFAIDKPETSPLAKDAWMAARVEELKGNVPLLVLSGNLQAIKRVEWINPDINARFLAERLRRKEIKTASIMQYWTKGDCSEGRVSKFILARGPKAESYVNDILETIGAKTASQPYEITDSIIVWKCIGESGTVADGSGREETGIPDEPVEITDSIKDTDLKLEDITLSELKNDIKNHRVKAGMSRDHVLLSRGKPSKAVKRDDLGENVEQWFYECTDDWGFDYECIIVTFDGNQAATIFDIE